MKKFLGKLFTLGELLLGFAIILLALGSVLPLFILNALLGIAGFFIVLDGLEHIDDPVNPPKDNNTQNEKRE